MAEVTELLPAALAGDREAQDELFRLSEPELRQLAWHWLRRYSAQERVQVSDVLDRAFLKLMKLDSPDWKHRGQFYSFACRNILTVLIDLLRGRDRRRERSQDEGDPEASIEAIPQRPKGLSEAALTSLKHALEELETDLSPVHRDVVELKFIGEFTLDEIAEITALHRSKVDRMLKVALQCLREKLDTSFPEFGRTAKPE